MSPLANYIASTGAHVGWASPPDAGLGGWKKGIVPERNDARTPVGLQHIASRADVGESPQYPRQHAGSAAPDPR